MTADGCSASAADMGKEPEEEREDGAEDEAGDDGEIKRGVLAVMDDVAGQAAKTEGESAAEVEKRADSSEDNAEEKQVSAEISERLHKEIVREPTRTFRTSRERFLRSGPMQDIGPPVGMTARAK
jgi:hypothetical protein